MDEPSAALSLRELDILFELIRRLKSEGTSIIYISHVLEEVLEVADRYTVLRDGATVGGGPARGASASAIVLRREASANVRWNCRSIRP